MNLQMSRAFSRRLIVVSSAMALFAAVPASAALTFNYTYDSSIPAGELAQVKSSMVYIASEFAAAYTNNVTLNFTIAFDSTVGLAQSSASYDYQGHTYAEVRTALLTKVPSLAADLPLVNPTSPRPGTGGSGLFSLTTANEKALGLAQTGTLVGSSTSDGTATFGPGPWTFFPSGLRKDDANPTEFDFTGSMEHEISELMGRQSGLAQSVDWGYEPLDLSRYSAAGVRSFDPATNATGNAVSAYFSLNNGTTNLMAYNDVTGGDIHDWAGQNDDSYDAFGPPNDATPITAVDQQVVNAVGWIASPVPEPASLTLLALGSLALLTRRRHGEQE